jgi:hypothetical protein
VLKGSVERFSHQAQGVKEVAFPGPVLPEKESQWAKCYRTFLDALIIIKNHPLQKYRINHKRLQFWISKYLSLPAGGEPNRESPFSLVLLYFLVQLALSIFSGSRQL